MIQNSWYQAKIVLFLDFIGLMRVQIIEKKIEKIRIKEC